MNTLNLEELEELDGRTLTFDEANELDENENIKYSENCGESGLHIGKTWYVYKLVNDKEINIYC